MHISNRKKVVAGATLALLAFSSGLGIAYYNATISETTVAGASVSTDGPQDLTATLVSAAAGLVPGAPAKQVQVLISNPNGYHVGVDDVLTLDVANLTSDSPGCTAAEALLTVGSTVAVNEVFAAGATRTVAFDVAMTSSPTVDQTACIGATFTIPLAVA